MTKNCNPITISNCPPTNTCDECVETIDTECVIYKGSALTNLGVVDGDSLYDILIKLEALIPDLLNP